MQYKPKFKVTMISVNILQKQTSVVIFEHSPIPFMFTLINFIYVCIVIYKIMSILNFSSNLI